MSMAWEVTTDDVVIVLSAHGITADEKAILDEIDVDEVEDIILNYTSMEDQVDASLSYIEDCLMDVGVIPKAEKKFHNPEND